MGHNQNDWLSSSSSSPTVIFFFWVWMYLWNTFGERCSNKVLCSKWEGGCGKDFWGNRCSRPRRSPGNLSSVLHTVPKLLPPVCLDIWVVHSACFRRVLCYMTTHTAWRERRMAGMVRDVPLRKLFLFPWVILTTQQRLWPSDFLTEENESVCNSGRSTKEWNIYPFDVFLWVHEKWMGNVE